MADESTAAGASDASSSSSSSEPAGGGIKSAAEVIEKVLANAKDDAGESAPAAAKASGKDKNAPGRRVEALEAKAVEKAAAVEAAPDDAAGALERARYHLQHGDLAKALDVFGDLKSLGEGMPDAVREALGRKLGVNSAQWERLRKFEAGAKRAVAAREQELSGIVQRLQAEYKPFHEARAAYEAGDYDAAFRAAFGEDAADYQRKVIGQRVGKNPEVEKLRAELEAERSERRQREEQQEQARAESEQRQAVFDYLNDLQTQCSESDDPVVRKYAARPAYIQRIYQIQKQSYDVRANTVMPLSHAAEIARDEILNSLKEWRVDDETGINPATTARASVPPAKPPAAKAPVRALKQSQAADTNGKPAKLSSEQVRAYHQRLMEQLPADA